MLARTPVVYSICSLQTYTLYLVSLITNNLYFITVLFICHINHYHTITDRHFPQNYWCLKSAPYADSPVLESFRPNVLSTV